MKTRCLPCVERNPASPDSDGCASRPSWDEKYSYSTPVVHPVVHGELEKTKRELSPYPYIRNNRNNARLYRRFLIFSIGHKA